MTPPNTNTPTKQTTSTYNNNDNISSMNTPKSLKPAVSSQSLLEELRAKIDEQAGNRINASKTEELLNSW